MSETKLCKILEGYGILTLPEGPFRYYFLSISLVFKFASFQPKSQSLIIHILYIILELGLFFTTRFQKAMCSMFSPALRFSSYFLSLIHSSFFILFHLFSWFMQQAVTGIRSENGGK